MAFGDKMDWPNPAIETIPDCLITLNSTFGKFAAALKKCCDVPDNMAVESNGDCICLKCRRVVGVEHFNLVLGC